MKKTLNQVLIFAIVLMILGSITSVILDKNEVVGLNTNGTIEGTVMPQSNITAAVSQTSTILIDPTETDSPAAVRQEPKLTIEPNKINSEYREEEMENPKAKKITITANGVDMSATLVENSSTAALIELLAEGPLTIDMRDFSNFEKVGEIGATLPTNDEQITTEAGDLILYLGQRFVIYYAPNSWDFTRLGKIDDLSAAELKSILGSGDVTVTIRLGE